jgi:hypothetical protein
MITSLIFRSRSYAGTKAKKAADSIKCCWHQKGTYVSSIGGSTQQRWCSFTAATGASVENGFLGCLDMRSRNRDMLQLIAFLLAGAN